MDKWNQIYEEIRREREAKERHKRDAVTDAREGRREGRETTNVWIAGTSAFVALVALALTFLQVRYSREDAKQAQDNFEATRKESAASADQARKDTLDQFKQQLETQHDLRDQAARSAKAAESSATTAAQTLRVSERAYIAINASVIRQPAPNGIPPRFQLTFVNVGRTPAIKLQAYAQLIEVPRVPGSVRESHD